MEMIQLMATPSADRIAQGSAGSPGLVAIPDVTVDFEFTKKLDAAIFEVQNKEVNPDELIAQLVGLDLKSAAKPNLLTDGEKEYSFDLRIGRIAAPRESDGIADYVIDPGTFASERVPAPSNQRTDADLIEDGQADFDHGFRTGGGCYGAPNGGAAEYANGGDADRDFGFRTGGGFYLGPDAERHMPIDEDLTADRNRAASRDSLSGLIDSVRREVRGWVTNKLGLTSSAAETTTRIRVDGDGPVRGLRFEAGSELGTVDPIVNGLATAEVVEEPGSTGLKGRTHHGGGVTSYVLPNDVQFFGKAFGKDWPIEPGTPGAAPAGQGGRSSRVMFRGTGQGRPEDRALTGPTGLTMLRETPLGLQNSIPIPISVSRPAGLVNSIAGSELRESEVLQPIVAQELKKMSLAPRATAETAPAIIEGLAGRLTSESFGLKPQAVVTRPTAEQTEGVISPATQSERIPKAMNQSGDLPVEVAFAEGSDTDKQTGLNKGTVSDTGLASTSQFEDLLESPESVEKGDSLEVEFSRGTERAETSAKVQDPKLMKAVPKEIEAALSAAREKLAEAVMDLAAARRPMTMKVRLTPFDLGTIDVSVRTVGSRVDVDLRASDRGVRDGLAAFRSDLVRTIESGGTTVSSMNVGQQAEQSGNQAGGRGGEQTSREDFRQAVNLGQVLTGVDAPAPPASSYGTAMDGRVDLAA